MSIFKTLVVSIFVATVDGYPEVMVVKTPKGKGNSSIPALADPLKNCPFGVVRGDKTEARCATVDDYMVVASNSSETTQVAEVSSGSASFPNFDDPGRLNAERRQIAKGKNGVFLDYHFLRPVRGRQRLRSKNPCYVHDKKDGYEGVYCLPSFYILGPQKCGTTDTFDKTMRHVDVVRLNPKQGELLEPHLFTNQIDESLAVLKHSSRRKGPPAPLLFRNSQRQFSRHQNELLAQKRIAGDASADLMYRMALPQMPSALLMHAVQPDAKLIAVLRDPVERTYSDFRFFFHCGVGFFHFEKCPLWWPHPHVNDLRQPAKRFHAVVETEVAEFKACLRGTERKQLFPLVSKVTHARPPPRSSRRRLLHGGSNQSSVGSSSNVGTRSSSGISGISGRSGGVNASLSVGDVGRRRRRRRRRLLDVGRSEEVSTNGLLYSNPELLRTCKYREDLNRDAGLNKCYSGRAVLSVYAAFLVDWLAHFPGQQLLVLPLEGLDTTPRNWIGGVYSFLGLRPPREHEWQDIAPGTTPTSDFTRKKQQPATPAQAQTAGGVSGEGAGVFIVRKTSDTLSCGHGLPDVHFGPMQANTRLHLQRFFNPWNDELRKLLLDKKVHTVPGYGLSPNSNPLRFPSSDAHSEAKAAAKSRGGKSSSSSSSSSSGGVEATLKQKRTRSKIEERRMAEDALRAEKWESRKGLWWWDYEAAAKEPLGSSAQQKSSLEEEHAEGEEERGGALGGSGGLGLGGERSYAAAPEKPSSMVKGHGARSHARERRQRSKKAAEAAAAAGGAIAGIIETLLPDTSQGEMVLRKTRTIDFSPKVKSFDASRLSEHK